MWLIRHEINYLICWTSLVCWMRFEWIHRKLFSRCCCLCSFQQVFLWWFSQKLYDGIKKEEFKIPEEDGASDLTTFFNPDREGWLVKEGQLVSLTLFQKQNQSKLIFQTVAELLYYLANWFRMYTCLCVSCFLPVLYLFFLVLLKLPLCQVHGKLHSPLQIVHCAKVLACAFFYSLNNTVNAAWLSAVLVSSCFWNHRHPW